MSTATHRVFDPLLPASHASAMRRLCERFGSYGMYSQEASAAEIGEGLFQRHDAVMNFLTSPRPLEAGRPEPTALALLLIDEYVRFPQPEPAA